MECLGRTVLLVDDDTQVLQSTRRLVMALGYAVIAASTPLEALRLADEHADELLFLLTDVVMPEMNGVELACAIKAKYPHVRCILMSGYPVDLVAGASAPCVCEEFLPKPFGLTALSRVLLATLGKSAY